MHNWSPNNSGCRPSGSISCKAIPIRSHPVSAPAGRRRLHPAGGGAGGVGEASRAPASHSSHAGQRVTGTSMAYALPRGADGPSFVFETHNVPCKTNPLGVKGAGEAGAIGSCPAVVNAIIDGLWREYKIDHIDMPATPERVWIAIREHQRRHSL